MKKNASPNLRLTFVDVIIGVVCALFLSPTFLLAQETEGAGFYKLSKQEIRQLCDTQNIRQYYNYREPNKFPMSKDSLRVLCKQKCLFSEDSTQNGFFTVRFIINCKGLPLAFRTYEVDSSYKHFTFKKHIADSLEKLTKSIKNWTSHEQDYFFFITYKIKNGKIENIIP